MSVGVLLVSRSFGYYNELIFISAPLRIYLQCKLNVLYAINQGIPVDVSVSEHVTDRFDALKITPSWVVLTENKGVNYVRGSARLILASQQL